MNFGSLVFSHWKVQTLAAFEPLKLPPRCCKLQGRNVTCTESLANTQHTHTHTKHSSSICLIKKRQRANEQNLTVHFPSCNFHFSNIDVVIFGKRKPTTILKLHILHIATSSKAFQKLQSHHQKTIEIREQRPVGNEAYYWNIIFWQHFPGPRFWNICNYITYTDTVIYIFIL